MYPSQIPALSRWRRRLGAGCLILGAALGGLACAPVPQVEIPEPYPVEVTGMGYSWHFRYPGPDGELGNGDDLYSVGEVVLPVDTEAEFRLTSTDYIYMFGVPEYDTKEIAIPDRWYTLRFTPEKPGVLQFEGDQMCGIAHEGLNGEVRVRTRDSFRRWTKAQARRPAS